MASKSAPCIADHIIFDLQCSMQRPSLFLMQAPKPDLAAAFHLDLLQHPAPAASSSSIFVEAFVGSVGDKLLQPSASASGLVGSLHNTKLLQPRASATICCWSRFTTCWQICSMNLSKSSNVVCVPWRYVRQHCRSRQRHVKLSSFVLLSDSFLQHSAANFS